MLSMTRVSNRDLKAFRNSMLCPDPLRQRSSRFLSQRDRQAWAAGGKLRGRHTSDNFKA